MTDRDRFRAVAAAAVVAHLCVACGNEPSPAPAALAHIIRDSADVVIAENPLELLEQSEHFVPDTPSTQIGAVEGAEHDQLFEVRGVRQLTDGSILVLNSGTHQVRRYDTSGMWISSSGSRGAGPGEMQFPVMMLSMPGDSTWVLDFGSRRLHVVDQNGTIVGAVPLQSPLSGLAGVIDPQTVVTATPNIPRGVYNTVTVAQVAVEVVDLDRGVTDTLAVLPGYHEYRYTQGELVRAVRVPFTVMPTVRVRGEEIFITDGITPEVRIYGRDGQLRRIMRIPLSPSPVNSDDWNAVVEATLAARAGSTSGEGRLGMPELERQKSIYQEMARPTELPYFDDMLLTDADRVWVRKAAVPASTQTWLAFDSGGRVVSQASLPASLRVREIAGNRAVGTTVDSLGVEYVLAYSLH